MTKRAVSVAAVAALALVAGASSASAQGLDRQGPGDAKGGAPAPPASVQPAPQQKLQQPPQAVAPQAPSKAPRRAEERGAARERGPEPEKQARERRPEPEKRAPEKRASERSRGKDQNKQATGKDRQDDRRRATEGATPDSPAPDSPAEKGKRRAAEKEQQKSGSEREGQPARQGKAPEPKQADRGKDQRSGRGEELRRERGRLSDDQRGRLRRSFLERRHRSADVNIRVHIGAALPRRVSLYAVPASVVSIFPRYRNYRYVLVDDTICIVDPTTYEIVDIIDERPGTPGGRPQMAELSLSEREKGIVLDSIPPDFPSANLRLRLALGASIPEGTQLFEFAPVVVDRIPKLRDYRFVVSDDQVVVVGSRDRSIAVVIDR